MLPPHTLRGLAHPLRVQILGILREQGASTATRLAGRLGESSGSTSYHLRKLAGYGFVEEDAGRNTGRERWWRVVDPGDTATGSRILRLTPTEAADLQRRIESLLDEYPGDPVRSDARRVVFQWRALPQLPDGMW
ncbi:MULTISPECIES: winged helix-turn-helix domain-containing protein [Actinoplanes]|uniref:helix-turn-helix domain-containing protein n=1 Tax=Actinoplanes rectilineatus TaxID=113571 RepID=UPI000B2F1582|nr:MULTISPECIES: winged helix-turn-helix domain-containing protein [Actinoplanes]